MALGKTSGRVGWSAEEIRLLREQLRVSAEQGRTLKTAFDETARLTGRKPNSIRNYYYASLREETQAEARQAYRSFTKQEEEELVRNFLIGQAQGLSVRSCALQMGCGEKRLMLRYQNKYRSMLRKCPERIRQIRTEMDISQITEPRISIAAWKQEELERTVQKEVRAAFEKLRQDLIAGTQSQRERLRRAVGWLDSFLESEDPQEKKKYLEWIKRELCTEE